MAVQINLSEIENHVGKKVKILCKILSSPSSNEFVVADKTDYKILLVNEDNIGNKHLQVGNFIKLLNPEIATNGIKFGANTSIFATPEIKGIFIPPIDDPAMKKVAKVAPVSKTINELENTIMIASTFEMEKFKVTLSLKDI